MKLPKKVIVTTTIAVHPIQAKILEGLNSGKIDIENDTLRGIAEKIGIKSYPQQVKHHLEQMLNLGMIQKIYGQYVFYKK